MKNFGLVLLLSGLLLFSTYTVLVNEWNYGLSVLAMTCIPLMTAIASRLELKRLIPDMIFGAIDTGLLTFAALLGAAQFGVVGAIIGGVVGDAVTDGIAGFFEGSIAEWLRNQGIEESRTALGSACGKTCGCLFGSGIILVMAYMIGISPDGL